MCEVGAINLAPKTNRILQVTCNIWEGGPV